MITRYEAFQYDLNCKIYLKSLLLTLNLKVPDFNIKFLAILTHSKHVVILSKSVNETLTRNFKRKHVKRESRPDGGNM